MSDSLFNDPAVDKRYSEWLEFEEWATNALNDFMSSNPEMMNEYRTIRLDENADQIEAFRWLMLDQFVAQTNETFTDEQRSFLSAQLLILSFNHL